ncbi:MAG TPA: CHAP domain-containing protein [Terriglobales bacterium]|nr:CHAP domain-containing protein [Terriglobales bacterium]
MIRLRLLVAATAIAVTVLPARIPTALAASPNPAPSPSAEQQLAQLNTQLSGQEAKLADLNNQVEHAQSDVDAINRKLSDDKQREATLGKELSMMGRLEYEQPTLRLTTILQATSLQQLFANIAQARLVANKERNLLNQAHDLRQQDEQAHVMLAARLGSVQAARDEAGQVAAQTLSLRNTVQDQVVRAHATNVLAQAQAQIVPFSGSGPYPNHFTFGYCTYYVATRRYIPWFGNAIDWWPNARAYGYPEGQTPQVGAVLVTRESAVGHVAYVESVSGSTFVVSEMNFTAWDVVDRRTITLGGRVPVVGFIYG